MRQSIELAAGRQEELLREAASRQASLTLNCRVDNGWTTGKSFLLGFEPASGDLIVTYPSGSSSAQPEIVAEQSIGVTFRRAHRKCVFETTVSGRCSHSMGRAEEVPALWLKWPERIYEMQRRLYYRTPVPLDAKVPVQVRPLAGEGECDYDPGTRRGQMADLCAGGLSLVLRAEDNPRWRPNTPVQCRFTAVAGGPVLVMEGLMRYLYELPEGGVRMGVQFAGLETDSTARPLLSLIAELTLRFQEIEKRRQVCRTEEC